MPRFARNLRDLVAGYVWQAGENFAKIIVRMKNRGRTGKRLANIWSGKKIFRSAHAGRGQETKWEIPV
jgi:hypothetical protein